MSYQNIDDEKMIVICEALKLNSSLTTIYLYDNKITHEGEKLLQEVLKLKPKLQIQY